MTLRKEKVMKKTISVILVIFTLSLTLTGCKNERTAAQPKSTQSLPTIESSQTDLILNASLTTEFSDDVVTSAQIETLLKSAAKTLSQSSSALHFTAIMKEKLMKEIMPEATKGCVVIAISSPAGSSDMFECALASQNIYLCAQSMGLGALISTDRTGTVNSTDLRKNVKLEEGFDVKSLVLVGYPKENTVKKSEEAKDLNELTTYID